MYSINAMIARDDSYVAVCSSSMTVDTLGACSQRIAAVHTGVP